MRVAIVGSSGLIGSQLCEMYPEAKKFNSKNIHEVRNSNFDLLFLSTLPAEKWKANLFPQEDAEVVRTVSEHLASVSSERTLLVSTVDVFGSPVGVYESHFPIESEASGYGKNRLKFEKFVNSQFGRTWTVRLPGLVGARIKKNVLYDLKSKSICTLPINSQFQFYPLSRLAEDLVSFLENDPGFLHLVAEPILLSEIADRFGFSQTLFGGPLLDAPKYDVRSSKVALWGKAGDFQVSKDESIEAISVYFNGE